jgi:hypothetical protein
MMLAIKNKVSGCRSPSPRDRSELFGEEGEAKRLVDMPFGILVCANDARCEELSYYVNSEFLGWRKGEWRDGRTHLAIWVNGAWESFCEPIERDRG